MTQGCQIEGIYVRLPEVKEQCDSGEDALVVRVHADEGITGIGEVARPRSPRAK